MTCDPARVRLAELTDDSDLLLDRPGYWVVHKDVLSKPAVGDELCLHLTERGEVRYSRNGRHVGTLMHVDCSLPLWAFIDVYGSTQEIQCLGILKRTKIGICQRQVSSPTPTDQVDQVLGSLRMVGIMEVSSTLPSQSNSYNDPLPSTPATSHRQHGSRSANATPNFFQGPLGDHPSSGGMPTGSQDILTARQSYIGNGAMEIDALATFLGIHQCSCMTCNASSQPAMGCHQVPSSNNPQVCIHHSCGLIVQNSRTSISDHHSCGRNCAVVCANHRTAGGMPSQPQGVQQCGTTPTSSQPTSHRTQLGRAHERATAAQSSCVSIAPSSDLFKDALPALPAPLIPVPFSALMAAAGRDSSQRTRTSNASAGRGTARTEQESPQPGGPSARRWSNITQASAMDKLVDISATGSTTTAAFPTMPSDNSLALSDISAMVVHESLLHDVLAPLAGCPSNECAVCLEHPADSALYTCGHTCMCYQCAQELVRKPKPLCPICRQPILDVIKIFRS